MGDIAASIAQIREIIERAAEKSGRRGSDITLVAASKMNDAARVKEAIAAGVDAVGENRVQELLEKLPEGAYEGAPLHFIGHLQTNKVKNVVGVCDLIESVDSVRLVDEIDRHAKRLGIRQNILIEVNIGREPAKSGILPEGLEDLLGHCSLRSHVAVSGLMAIPPAESPTNAVSAGRSGAGSHRFFDEMLNLFVDIQGKKYDNVTMRHLSMGMSESYIGAIESGATMVRIGSAIFGARHYM